MNAESMPDETNVKIRLRPQPYRCPHCKWEFSSRKSRCCRACGTLLLIPTDHISDRELAALRSFWMWDPVRDRWKYISDWEEHKRREMQKFEEYFASCIGTGPVT